VTRPIQEQTPAVYFSSNIRHGRHVTTVGTLDVVYYALLEVRGDRIPEYVGCRGEWWLHKLEPFGERGIL
jgi:hypothetical protein